MDRQPDALRAVRFMYSYPLRYWRPMAVSQAIMLMSMLLAVLIPIVLRQAIDVGVLDNNPGLLLGSAAVVFGVGVLSVSLLHLGKRLRFVVASKVVVDLRRDLLRRILLLGPVDVAEASGGQALTRLTADVTALRGVVNGGLYELINQLIMAVVIFGVCFAIDSRITLIALAPLVVIALGTLRVQRHLQPIFAEIRGHFTTLLSGVAESLANVRVTKAFSRERQESRRLDQINATLAARQRTMRMTYNFWNAGFQLVAALPVPITLWLGAQAVLAGELSVGALVALVALIMMGEMSLHMVTMDANGIFHTVVVGRRLLRIMDVEPALRPAVDTRAAPSLSGAVTVENVRLSLGERTVLEGVGLEIAPGELVVLVGPTGGGKSMLLELLARLRDPSAGCVRYDGIDGRELDVTSLRREVVCLPQRQWIFEGTVADNIRFARPEASDAEVAEAAVAAGLGPLPLERQVAAGAADLSAGEWQRVGLARALLVDPSVLLLDNPTANLDGETEARFVETILRLRAHRTLIIATQQPSLVRHADRVLVVTEGMVQSTGEADAAVADAFLDDMLAVPSMAAADGRRHHG
ncbi:MAG: ABC transporter ATP-binding protein [Pseudonocardiaceae bacterium]